MNRKLLIVFCCLASFAVVATALWWFTRTMPLLQTLARHDKNAYVKLLEEGADPNKCDRIGSCAMNQAAREDDPYWLRTALAHGGDPNVINERNPYYPNSTPIFYAISKERPVNAKILVEAGANINHQDGFGETPLRKAAGTGVYETVVLLLEAGADPYLADRHGYSLVNWFNGRDESMVPDKEQIPWFRKAREILIKRGVIKQEPNALENAKRGEE